MVVLTNQNEAVEMRKVYVSTMIELARADERVVALDCDLMSPIGMMPFKKEFPDRAIDCGIMEATMAGVAAGMSVRGCIPFTHTFACYQSRKTLDQLFLTAGFSQANVKTIGSDPGILALYNGASHMGLEDMGVLMNIPNITLIEPCDAVALEAVIRQIKDIYGLHYVRMNRKDAEPVYDKSTEFTLGKGLVLREGSDVTLIASGLMVKEAIKAADLLELEGISAKVVDIFTWKPIDEQLIINCAHETGAIVTAENHRISTGLGSAVANILVEKYLVPLERIGIGDEYGEVGTLEYLMKRFDLTAEDIVIKAKKAIGRKTD